MNQNSIALTAITALLLASGCADPHSTSAPFIPAPPEAPLSEAYQPEKDSSANIKLTTWAGQVQVQDIKNFMAAGSTPEHSTSNAATTTTTLDRIDELQSISRFFLVETPSAGIVKSYLAAMKDDAPGGIVFWNTQSGGAQEISNVIHRYSKELEKFNQKPILFSTDNEGGGLSLSPSGNNIPGIQRFRKGFTDIAHGSWLGQSLSEFGTELCELHGRLMGLELSAVGINYPLTLVSDLQQNLFKTRGISKNPEEVAECMKSFIYKMAEAGPVIAVTKHYPGLGQTIGDTHDVQSVSRAKTKEDSDRHLYPFRRVIDFANKMQIDTRLSIMSSHGKFPFYDADHLTTESPILLTEMLRDQFDFHGIRVSDAMWMGEYSQLQSTELYAVYLNAFVSGEDLLMIPGNRFGGALKAFRNVYLGQVDNSFKAAIEKRSGLSYDRFQTMFRTRVTESLERYFRTVDTLPYAHKAIDDFHKRYGKETLPSQTTSIERNRYYSILKSINPKIWADLKTEEPRH